MARAAKRPNHRSSGLHLPMPVWDLPTRLFHWILPVLLIVSYVSVQENYMRVHLASGITVLALLVFRVIWGLVGSETARFSHFLHSPFAALRHLLHLARREPDTQIGHNAAGGWMVLVMLLILFAQVGTGLFANDDGATEGPLAKFVRKDTSDWLSKLHGINFDILLGAIVLHLLAIAAYAILKRHNLVRPMISGKKRLPAATPAPRMASPLLAAVLLAVIGVGAWLLATWV